MKRDVKIDAVSLKKVVGMTNNCSVIRKVKRYAKDEVVISRGFM